MKHLCAAVLSLKGRLDHDAVVSMSAGSVSRTGNTVIHVTHCPAWPLMHECLAESDQGFRPLVTGFDGSQRRHTFEELVTRYNAIIEACETDPSLKIEVA
jgi:hypothetical protein